MLRRFADGKRTRGPENTRVHAYFTPKDDFVRYTGKNEEGEVRRTLPRSAL
jgi:hypothetical protein